MIEHDRGQDYVLCSHKGYRGNSYKVAGYSTYSRVATERKGKKKTKKRRQKSLRQRALFSVGQAISLHLKNSRRRVSLCYVARISLSLRLINQMAFRHLLSTFGGFSIFSLDNKTSTPEVFNSSPFIPRRHFETS